MVKCDFSGWATRANLRCADGRTILKDAFKHCDGATVPLVWNHQHTAPEDVLGHAVLENRDEGVYAYCAFNDSESAQQARELVTHGDICSLSIYANQLKQQGNKVFHGIIREVSLVLAGANPGAFIDNPIKHGATCEDEGAIFTGEFLVLTHSDEDYETPEAQEEKPEAQEEKPEEEEKMEENKELQHSEEEKKEDKGKTVMDVINDMTEEQQTAVYAVAGALMEEYGIDLDEESEGGNEDMKHNVFEPQEEMQGKTLCHADQTAILQMARSSSVGSLQEAIGIYCEENELAHGIDEIETLFPEFKNLNPGAPELIRADQSWVMSVINKIHKSPYSRIRTRQADARIAELRAKGYQKKGDEKTLSANIKLIQRTTDPQTVYRKDSMHRDDIIDITDFDVVEYQWGIMKDNMYEELAMAALVGDRRDDGDPDKIHETHIRSIWNDEELYTIHRDVDIAAMRNQLQGTDTNKHFSENYIYAEAIIQEALYAREKFKGSGRPDLYCAPHLVNVMLLARDFNGRRIYDSKEDLAKALNVGTIVEIEQFEGLTREDSKGDTKKLLGLFVNLADYQFGCTKGGELTKFEDFDIDFNQYKYLMETRLSGALTKVFSAIALEEPVTEQAEG